MSTDTAILDRTIEREINRERSASRMFYLKRATLFRGAIAVLVFGGLIAGTRYWIYARQFETTDDAFVEARVIPVAAKVEGYIVRLNVDDNQHVNAGDVIAVVDPRDFQASLDEAKAALSSAQSRLADSQAQLSVFEAQVQQARSDLAAASADAEFSSQNAARYRNLTDEAASLQDRQRVASQDKAAVAQVASAQAKLLAAQARLSEGKAAVQISRADVHSAEARLVQPQLNMAYTQIIAPQSGRIARRTVEQGAYVKAGQSLLAIVSDDTWVLANFKETQLAEMHENQPVNLYLDTYPGQVFKGHVDSLQPGTGGRFSLLPPENATGNYVKVVQRIPVKIRFDFARGESVPFLAPGMSVEPEVKVQ